MEADNFPHHRRIPTLVQLCQRAAVANVNSIHSLGDLSYQLVKPILGRCTTEQLLRFEQLSPHLEKDTSEIWRDLCFQKYHLTAVERYSSDDVPQEPDSWRSRYFALQELEAKRIDEVGSRIRTQRLEADERKKEKEVKYTDRVPPAKRPRTGGWGTISQPKTLFQKARNEASKVQMAYHARIVPPMPTAKTYRIFPPNSESILPSDVSSPSSSRVTVNTVTVHRRSTVVPASVAPKGVISTSSKSLLPPKDLVTNAQSIRTSQLVPPPNGLSTGSQTSVSSDPTRILPKQRSPAKKDPMASLFVPKRKMPAQRPR